MKNSFYKCYQCHDSGEYKVHIFDRYPERDLTSFERYAGYWKDYCDCELGKHLKGIESSGRDRIMLHERMKEVLKES